MFLNGISYNITHYLVSKIQYIFGNSSIINIYIYNNIRDIKIYTKFFILLDVTRDLSAFYQFILKLAKNIFKIFNNKILIIHLPYQIILKFSI